MASSPAEIAELIDTLQLTQTTRYAQIAAGVIVFYDIIVTLDQEYEFIWTKSWSYVKVLYLWNRYFGLLAILLDLITYIDGILTSKACFAWYTFQLFSSCLIIWTLQIIMQIRLWTLYDCSRKILVFMGLAFLSEVIAMTTIFGVMAQGTIVVSSMGACMFLKVPNLGVAFWIPSLIYEGFLLGLAVIAAYAQLERIGSWDIRTWDMRRLANVVLRDNILYFLTTITLYLATVIMLLKLSPILDNIPDAFTVSLTCILGSRLMLNLREAFYRPQRANDVDNDVQTYPTGTGTVFRSLQYRDPTRSDIEDSPAEAVIHMKVLRSS